jgi:hypothetical protein
MKHSHLTTFWMYLVQLRHNYVWRNGLLRIGTRYGTEGPRIGSGGGEIFRICPDQPWGPPNLLYYGYRVSFQGVKRWGPGVDNPHPSSVEVKERVVTPLHPLWGFMVCSRVNFTSLLHFRCAKRHIIKQTAIHEQRFTWRTVFAAYMIFGLSYR